MRILIFSDSHGATELCIKTIQNIIGVDMIIHAGDCVDDAQAIERTFPDIPIKYVRGNCDFTKAPTELLIEADGKKIFLTHGHLYNVKDDDGYAAILKRGKELCADIIVFGHTHVAVDEKIGEIALINPGSIRYSRKFGVIEVENGKIGTAVCDCNHIM